MAVGARRDLLVRVSHKLPVQLSFFRHHTQSLGIWRGSFQTEKISCEWWLLWVKSLLDVRGQRSGWLVQTSQRPASEKTIFLNFLTMQEACDSISNIVFYQFLQKAMTLFFSLLKKKWHPLKILLWGFQGVSWLDGFKKPCEATGSQTAAGSNQDLQSLLTHWELPTLKKCTHVLSEKCIESLIEAAATTVRFSRICFIVQELLKQVPCLLKKG